MSTARPFRAGLVQLRSSTDRSRNAEDACRSVREACRLGAELVVTPEMTNVIEARREELLAKAMEEAADPVVAAFRELASEHAIHIVIGSVALRSGDRLVNRCLLIAPDGAIAARYDKIHMFDVDLDGGESYRESRTYRPGERAVVTDLPWGRLGLTVCYDVRFPALYRCLAKAGPTSSPCRRRSPARPGPPIGRCCSKPGPSRPVRLSWRQRKGADTRAGGRLMATAWRSRRGARWWLRSPAMSPAWWSVTSIPRLS
jgi:hypothetical protein